MPYQLQLLPLLLTEEELLERMLDELGATEDGTDELLGATLERELLDELCGEPKFVARRDVALMPFALLIRKLPQVLSDPAFQLLVISSDAQQPPLPLQLQPM